MQVPAPLPPNAAVEVILPVHPGPSARSYRLPAIVTRCDKDGVGLMFDRVEPEMWVALLSHLSPSNAEDVATFGSSAAGGTSARSR